MITSSHSSAGRPALLHLSPLAAVGGCEVNCLRIMQGLPEFAHTVLVFDRRGPMSEKWAATGARVEHLECWQSGRRSFRETFAAWLRREKPPGGVFNWSTSRLPLVLDLLRGWNLPQVVHLGNPAAKSWPNDARRLVEEMTHRPVANVRLVACSDQVALSHRRSPYFRRFPIETIYNPVGEIFDRPRIYRSLPAGAGPRIGMVARLDSIKDHRTLIGAAAAIVSQRPDLVLEFAGNGDLRGELEREARSQGVADHVRFLGQIDDIPRQLTSWDIYVHSTTAAEGMGTAVAEAMMSGLPCLVSDIAVMREVCGDDAGNYAAPGDASAWSIQLLAMIDDRPRRESLGAHARLRARKLFSLSAVARRYLGVAMQEGRKVA